MGRFRKFINICASSVAILIVLFVLSLMPTRISLIGRQAVYAYNETGHRWIIKKAIEYLKDQKSPVASEFPLDDYLPWLIEGVDYADQAADIRCEWKWFNESNCDTIHHYGHIDAIDTALGFTVAHPGEFAAPDYAEVLFEQAIKFWPGGLEPSLSDLPRKDAGQVQISWFGNHIHLGDTWIGGFPFCEGYARSEGSTANQACPKWPFWAASNSSTIIEQRYTTYEESIENAIVMRPHGEYYLDTAIKLVAAVIEKYFTCAPPSAGNWVIPNKCICRESYTAPANVLVPDGVVLIVPYGVTLDIDFKNYSLKVKEGGGVLIREGGRIH